MFIPSRISPMLVWVVGDEEVFGLALVAVDLDLLGYFEAAEEGVEGFFAFVLGDLPLDVAVFFATGDSATFVLVFFLLVEDVAVGVLAGDLLATISANA